MVQKTQKNRSGKPPSQRQLRVGEQIRHTLSNVLFRGDVYDANLNTVSISITEVSISPDLRNATAYFVVLNGDGAIVEKALNRNAPYFKNAIAKTLNTRVHPKIQFKLDTTGAYASRIDALLDTL